MKRLFWVLLLSVTGLAVFAQDNPIRFLDGFGMWLDEGYSALVTDEGVVEISTPRGESIYGLPFYDDAKQQDDQSYILPLIYHVGAELYSEEGLTGEVTEVEYDTLGDGTDCYWVTVENGEFSYLILAVDLFPSPGIATGIFFCFPPFFGLDYSEQLDILTEFYRALSFEFYDAAG